MNREQINYICSNQNRWRGEFVKQKRMKKDIMRILGRQYQSKGDVNKDKIILDLVATLDVSLMCIKENDEGNLYVTQVGSI
jgi:hypothetical protein